MNFLRREAPTSSILFREAANGSSDGIDFILGEEVVVVIAWTLHYHVREGSEGPVMVITLGKVCQKNKQLAWPTKHEKIS